MVKRAALYVRVSTDKQTVENQIAALSKVASARGWQIVETFSDAGISGAKGRRDRPGLDELLKQAQRGRFDVVMAWAIDRLGRSLVDLLQTIESLRACGVDLYLDQQSIDTTTPAGKLMLQVCGAFAELSARCCKRGSPRGCAGPSPMAVALAVSLPSAEGERASDRSCAPTTCAACALGERHNGGRHRDQIH